MTNSNVDRIVAGINQIAENPDMRDEGEEAPSREVIEAASQLIRDADNFLAMPYGIPSTFFGEVMVTWKLGNGIVRLACFADKPNIIQTGSLTQPVGSYRIEPATSQLLAEHLGITIPRMADCGIHPRADMDELWTCVLCHKAKDDAASALAKEVVCYVSQLDLMSEWRSEIAKQAKDYLRLVGKENLT